MNNELGRRTFAAAQKLGKSLMLPVAVLPAAGLLIIIGSAEFAFLPLEISRAMAAGGNAIFTYLPILFALGVALGFTENDGIAALAAGVGYVAMLATMGAIGASLGYELQPVMGLNTINTGVFGGILVGAMASWLFNRFHHIQLPPYIGLFSGKRFVPLVTAFGAIILGVALSFIWPPFGQLVEKFSFWASTDNPLLAFSLYGFVDRLLLPFGLQHIWSVPFYFEVGEYLDPVSGDLIRGEMHRYIAGDPSAGNMAGGYLFKMFGLPAAGLAIWQCARPENRARVGATMISAALSSFITGVTEPIEFAFLFLAPVLYVLHALLTGVAYAICIELGIRHGLTFSHGLFDFILLYTNSTRGLWLLWLGLVWALVYYAIFRFSILHFNLPTTGRAMQTENGSSPAVSAAGDGGLSESLVKAFGGPGNIASLDACITRLRVQVREIDAASPAMLKDLGATDVLVVGNSLQAIFGTRSENLKTDMESFLATTGSGPVPQPSATAAAPDPTARGEAATPQAAEQLPGDIEARVAAIVAALGGRGNIRQATACAHTRLRIEIQNNAAVDGDALGRAEGVAGVLQPTANLVHLVVGSHAGEYERAMLTLLDAAPDEPG